MSPEPCRFRNQLAGNYMGLLIDKVRKSSIDWVLAEQPASNWSTVPHRQHPLPVQQHHLEDDVEVEKKEEERQWSSRGYR